MSVGGTRRRQRIRNTVQLARQSRAAVAGHREDAPQYLGKAIDLGYGGADEIAGDEDLKSLRGEAQFDPLITKARELAAPVKNMK